MATSAGLGRKTNRTTKPAVNEEHHDLILQSDRHHEITGGWLAGRVSQRLIQAPSNNSTSIVGFLRHRNHRCLVSAKTALAKTTISVGEATEITFRLRGSGADASPSFNLRQLGCALNKSTP